MIRLASFFGLIGLLIATGVVAWSGYDQVLGALRQAGWGIVWASAFHVVPMIACVLGWQVLLPGREKAGKLFFLYVLWIRASVNNLMPVARIGGEIVSVRVMIKHGMRPSLAVASTVVEITLSVLAQFAFVLLGIGFFLMHVGGGDVTQKLLWGAVLAAPLLGGMLYIQRLGVFGLLEKTFKTFLRQRWAHSAGNAARLDRAVRAMYRRRGKVLYGFGMQFISWALCGVEIWLALSFLGHPLSLTESLMLEAIIQAAASAAFIVPAALGVQEAGFVVFGALLGLPPEVAAALAVARRCRDVLLYVPGLLVWQAQEGRWLMKKGRV